MAGHPSLTNSHDSGWQIGMCSQPRRVCCLLPPAPLSQGWARRELFSLRRPAATEACLTREVSFGPTVSIVSWPTPAPRPADLLNSSCVDETATASSSLSSSFPKSRIVWMLRSQVSDGVVWRVDSEIPSVQDASWSSDCTWAF